MKNLLKKISESESFRANKLSKPQIKKIAFAIILSLLALSLYSTYINNSRYKGEVEARIVPCIAEVSGKIIESNISLGQEVKKGDVIAKLDSEDLNYTLTQMELNLQKKQLTLGEATIGLDSQATNSYLAAQTNYQSASIAAEKASKDYANAKELYAMGAISSTELESARVASASATSIKSTALAQLNNASSQSGENIAQIDIAILESQISQMKNNLGKYTLVAACDGIILSKNYGEGSMVSPGYNISDIGSFDEMYVVFYVSENKITGIQYNDEILVKAGGETISCIVKYIDEKTQYTPRELQTSANKSKTNFKVKLLLPESTSLKPGIEVIVNFK